MAATKNFAGLTGPLGFDKTGQLRRPLFIVGVQDGKARKMKRYSPKSLGDRTLGKSRKNP